MMFKAYGEAAKPATAYVGLFFVFCLTPQTPIVIGEKNTLSVNIYKTHGTILQFRLRKNLNLQQCSFYSTQALRYLTTIVFHCPCETKHTQHKLFRCTMSISYEIADRVFLQDTFYITCTESHRAIAWIQVQVALTVKCDFVCCLYLSMVLC